MNLYRYRGFAGVLTTLLITVLTAACSSVPPGAPGTDSENSGGLFTIRVASPSSFNEIYVADAMGFARDEGIQLDFTGSLAKGVTEYQLIEQGINDAFVGGHPPNVAQARLAGIMVKCVAPGMIDDPEYPHVSYLVKPDSPYRSLSETVGKKVAISSISGCTNGYVQYFLKNQGLDYNNVEFIVIPDPEGLLSLQQGLVDFIAAHPPYAGKAIAEGTAREVFNSWDIFQSPGAGLSVRGFSEGFIAEHPDVVQGFVNMMYRTRVWTNSHLEDAKKINAQYLDLEPSDVSSFYYDSQKQVSEEYVEKWFEISEEIGLWGKGEINPEDITDNQFTPEDPPAEDASLNWNGQIGG